MELVQRRQRLFRHHNIPGIANDANAVEERPFDGRVSHSTVMTFRGRGRFPSGGHDRDSSATRGRYFLSIQPHPLCDIEPQGRRSHPRKIRRVGQPPRCCNLRQLAPVVAVVIAVAAVIAISAIVVEGAAVSALIAFAVGVLVLAFVPHPALVTARVFPIVVF